MNMLNRALAPLFLFVATTLSATAQQNEYTNSTINVSFENFTYPKADKKATAGSVLGAIAKAVVLRTVSTQEKTYFEPIRASVITGIGSARRINLIEDTSKKDNATYIIEGEVKNIESDNVVKEIKTAKGTNHKTYFKADIDIELRLVDKQTGNIVRKGSISTYVPYGMEPASASDAIAIAMEYIPDEVTTCINLWFPIYANIVERGKQKNDKLKECYIDLGDKTKDLGKGTHFNVYTLSDTSKDGRKQIGKLEVKEVMGADLSLCKVKSGDKKIEAALEAGEKLIIESSN